MCLSCSDWMAERLRCARRAPSHRSYTDVTAVRLDTNVGNHLASSPMWKRKHHGGIARAALAAFLFSIAVPALAVVHRALDPLAGGTICAVADYRADSSPAGPVERHSVHCVLCVASASPPPAVLVQPLAIARVDEVLLPVQCQQLSLHNSVAFHPLHPRAPPRV